MTKNQDTCNLRVAAEVAIDEGGHVAAALKARGFDGRRNEERASLDGRGVVRSEEGLAREGGRRGAGVPRERRERRKTTWSCYDDEGSLLPGAAARGGRDG